MILGLSGDNLIIVGCVVAILITLAGALLVLKRPAASKGSRNTNPEILVYVKQEPLDTVYRRRVEPSSDGLKAYVTIDPETPNKAGWKLDVTDCIRPSTAGLYVEAIRGAQKAIKIDLANPGYTLSRLTNDEQQQVINMKIFKAHYGQLLKDLLQAIKPILIILAVVVVISVALSAWDAYTLSKIPATVVYVKPTPTPAGVIG